MEKPMKRSNLMPWDMPEYEVAEVEKALFKIFSTTDGHIVWAYLHKNILTPATHNTDSLHHDNGKRALVNHLRHMADRHFYSLQHAQKGS